MFQQIRAGAIPSRIYVTGWLACFGALALLVAISPRAAGNLVVAYSLAVISAASLMAIPANLRLVEYLKRNYHEQWARLVLFPNAPELWNCPDSMAILQFLFTRHQLGVDPILDTLKQEAKKRSLFLICIAVHLPVVWIMSVTLLS
jgi:di/tricarboxylate transporter